MTINAAIKIKYLTNRELLEQIHASKNTYCSYLENIYSNFDIITHDLNLITRETLEAAKIKKAELQTARLRKEAQARGEKNPSYRVDPESLDIEHVVVRLMTYDHIPPHPVKHQTGKTVAERHVKINFPAFQHYVWCNDNWLCVGKSHWRGGLQNGEFCNNHGYITNKLAFMFMKLVEKYSKKGNWRGYTYNDEMQGQALLQLSQIGLQFDESRSENPFAYYTSAVQNSFTRILNTEKRNQNIRDDLLIMHGSTPSYTRQTEHEIAQKTAE